MPTAPAPIPDDTPTPEEELQAANDGLSATVLILQEEAADAAEEVQRLHDEVQRLHRLIAFGVRPDRLR